MIRSLEGVREVAAEVHGEIRQVLKHYEVVFRGKFANSLQFLLVEAYPRRIVRVGIYDAADVVLGDYLLQLCNEFLSTIVVDV